MSESAPERCVKSRGTVLLEEFETSLPSFNDLDEDQHKRFLRAIRLLTVHYKITEDRLNKDNYSYFRATLNRLNELHDEYVAKDSVIASAILFAKTHIESYYLDDQDAKLVHNLTGLHIHCPFP
jgi:hypothetical protein